MKGNSIKTKPKTSRWGSRRAHQEAILLKSLTDSTSIAGHTLNLSETGVLVEVEGPLQRLPSILLLTLTLRGGSSEFQAVAQRVEKARGCVELGLRFVYLSEKQKRLLRHHVAST